MVDPEDSKTFFSVGHVSMSESSSFPRVHTKVCFKNVRFLKAHYYWIRLYPNPRDVDN